MKLTAVSSVVGGAPARQNINALSTDLKDYLELTLPYMAEKTRIRNGPSKAQLNDPAFWRTILNKKKEELQASKNDEANLIPVEPEAIG